MKQDFLAEHIPLLYEQHAEAFQRLRSQTLFEKVWLDRFLSLLPEQGRILDIGCGFGAPIAEYFIEHGFQLQGIDTSKTMIDSCRARFPEHAWQVADMRTLNLPGQFDGLIAWDSFFHLKQSDQLTMFRIFKQHAKTGAALMFTSGPENSEAIGSFEGKPLYHASLGVQEYKHWLHEHGFELLQMTVNDPACGQRTVWLAQKT